MDAQDYLRELSQATRKGAGFLLAYGVTWLAAADLGRRFGDRVGTYAALFQGLVGLPLGLFLTLGVAGGTRPVDPTLNALSIYLSMEKILILPIVIVLTTLGQNTLAVAALAVTLAVHFVPYAWLYATPIYLVVASVIAVGTALLVAKQSRHGSAVTPICVLTGAALLLGGGVALIS